MRITGSYIQFLVLAVALSFLPACQNDMAEVQQLEDVPSIPDLVGEQAQVYYSDSAVLKMRMEAPRVEQYLQLEEPYVLFPEGIKVVFYDDAGMESTEITGTWGAYYQSKLLWEIKGDVNYRSVDGVRIQTEQAFWDEKKALIYSELFTRYTDRDGTVFIGEHGFEAAQDMSRWKWFQTRRSTITIRE